MGASLPGARVSLAVIGSPARPDALTLDGSSFCKPGLLLGGRRGIDPGVQRRPVLGRDVAVVLAGILAGAGEDLRGQQVEDRAILVGRPDGAVSSQEAGAGAFFAAEAERPVDQSRGEPLEADRDLGERPAQALHDAVDQAAAHQRLADLGVRWTSRAGG